LPIRENIHVTRLCCSAGRGGVEVAMTVIDCLTAEAVLGMALTTLHEPVGRPLEGDSGYKNFSIWSPVTPARIEMSSLPANASFMPAAPSTSLNICGLQPSNTTSASCTAFTFSLM